MQNAKIQTVFNSGKIFSVLTHYTFTDDFEDFLSSRGKKVLMIHYGFSNEFDLIVYDSETKK